MKYKIPPCPCGSKLPYGNCCQPIHINIRTAKIPEQIIRARFAAMALGDIDFFRQSIIRKHRHILNADDLTARLKHQILHSIKITHVERKGFLLVNAIIHSQITKGKRGKLTTHAERTYLKRESRAWRVVEIDIVETNIQPPKGGKNVPCPCGSGRKYKHCCGIAQ